MIKVQIIIIRLRLKLEEHQFLGEPTCALPEVIYHVETTS